MNGIAGALGPHTPWELWQCQYDDDLQAICEFNVHIARASSRQRRSEEDERSGARILSEGSL